MTNGTNGTNGTEAPKKRGRASTDALVSQKEIAPGVLEITNRVTEHKEASKVGVEYTFRVFDSVKNAANVGGWSQADIVDAINAAEKNKAKASALAGTQIVGVGGMRDLSALLKESVLSDPSKLAELMKLIGKA